MEKIAEIHKENALLELRIKTIDRQNLTPEMEKTYKLDCLTKIYANYEKLQSIIELKKADISIAKRDINLSDSGINLSNQYECKYLVSKGI